MEEELRRLEYTLGEVENTLNVVTHQMQKINKQSTSSRASFSGANENSQEYIELMINSILEESVKVKLKNLYAAKSKPYFARIDFKEEGRDSREKFYIGKVALIKEENQELVIVDWRAPVANLYYENRVGKAEYKSPGGLIEGNLYLKRQFSIEDGKLKDVFDIDITTNDEFLQKYLGANAENRLKDIVSTIQVEQNRVIRANMWKPLIVQGAAGSGKTTITCLLGAAKILNELKNDFEGTILLIFQPGEEKAPGGARLMLEDGLFADIEPEMILAQHVSVDYTTGTMGFRPGMIMASADEIHVKIHGKGGHGALPHLVNDTVLAASQCIVSLQQVRSRLCHPLTDRKSVV